MKIALVNSEYPTPSGADHGGIATYTVTLAHLLARYGHTVHVCTRSGIHPNLRCRNEALCADPDIRYHRFGFQKSTNIVSRIITRFSKNPLTWEQGHARALATLLSGIAAVDGLDIIEIPEYGGLANGLGTRLRIPCVTNFHTPSELVDIYNHIPPQKIQRERYAFERSALRRSTAFKSPSNALKQWVCNRYGIDDSSVRCIRNPFDSGPLRKINHVPVPPVSPRFDILFSGRFERRKGAEMLLHSIREILAIDEAITFTIAGETETGNAPNYRLAIERILSPQERSRTWFPGPLSHEKLLPLYRNSSLFLFPSLFENSPYSLIEAMAAGLPVVATAGSGIGEIISHNESGMLFSPDNRTELVAHIRELFGNRERAAALGRRAAETVDLLFDPEKIAAEHIAHYESVCKGIR